MGGPDRTFVAGGLPDEGIPSSFHSQATLLHKDPEFEAITQLDQSWLVGRPAGSECESLESAEMLEDVVKAHKAPTVADGQRCKLSGGVKAGGDSALTHQWMPILLKQVLSGFSRGYPLAAALCELHKSTGATGAFFGAACAERAGAARFD